MGIVIFIVFYFTIGRRKGKDPVRLNLHKDLEKNQKTEVSGDFTQLILDKTKEQQAPQVQVVVESSQIAELPPPPVEPATSSECDITAARDVSPISTVEAEVVQVESQAASASPKPPSQFCGKIYFVYNGHEWECHEVLGIPSGSTLHVATEMYQYLIKTSDPSTFEFYEAAYRSILKRKSETKI